jgi:hypothetical protein
LSDSDLRIINWRRAIIKNLERKISFWFKVKQLGAAKEFNQIKEARFLRNCSMREDWRMIHYLEEV